MLHRHGRHITPRAVAAKQAQSALRAGAVRACAILQHVPNTVKQVATHDGVFVAKTAADADTPLLIRHDQDSEATEKLFKELLIKFRVTKWYKTTGRAGEIIFGDRQQVPPCPVFLPRAKLEELRSKEAF